ncbi:hypothetical protein V6L78_26940 [Pseudomonas canadensis]|uniref:hypothetical protein n=1 Tax=Pseudomonas canadensis TaxID=915099 RepID=UPI0030D184EE
MNIDWSKCPEATHFDPVDQNFLREIDESLLLFNTIRGWTVPTYTQYGVTIKDCHRPLIKRPEWTGEGLPPVGMVCEYTSNGGLNWRETSVLFIDEQVVLLSGYPLYKLADPDIAFRPIRTPEQIATEEREAAIQRMLAACPYPGSHDGVARLYTEALYDAGYRKQSAP